MAITPLIPFTDLPAFALGPDPVPASQALGCRLDITGATGQQFTDTAKMLCVAPVP